MDDAIAITADLAAAITGITADQAYAEAGFKPDRRNATRLKANESIVKRVAELLEWEQTSKQRLSCVKK